MYRVARDIPQHVIANMQKYFLYDPETGKLVWAKDDQQVRAGDEVGYTRKETSRCQGGYRYFCSAIVSDGKSIAVHRAIWAMNYGSIDPYKCVDHIDGDPTNNRLSNLRLVSLQTNAQNQHKASKNSVSGLPGVFWFARTKRWMSRVQYTDEHGRIKHEYLGYFSDKEAAYQAYLEAKRRLHPGNTL